MIKGDPQIGEEVWLSYNTNVGAFFAGDDLLTFHDEDMTSDEAIKQALILKCGVVDPEAINLDNIYWAPKA